MSSRNAPPTLRDDTKNGCVAAILLSVNTQTVIRQLLVFGLTPFKIDQNKNQKLSIDKVQNLGNKKEVNMERPSPRFRPEEYFCIRDIRRKFFTKLIEICMETSCWCPSGWAPTWRTETNRNICYRVLLEKREFVLRGTLQTLK